MSSWEGDYGEWQYIWTDQYGLFNAQQTQNNVYIIARYFREQGWTDQAIASMCGNMWAESYINPAQWEGGHMWSPFYGFGLVQWTPRTKYSDWADSVWDYNWDFQMFRIQWELVNGVQWDNVGFGTFWQFAHVPDGLDYLTEAFLRSYEKPRDPDATLDYRIQRSIQCWEWINGGVPPYRGKKKKKIILFKIAQNNSMIGKQKHWGGD